MPHAIWNGSISFGLVTIPVSLLPAEDRSAQLSFHLLDARDLAPVRQKRVNESTAEEVPWEHVAKGYKLDDGSWVVLSEDDFRAANVEATQTIDILSAVCADEIDETFYATPYYLVPTKTGRKAYALLRETLRRAGRVALAKIVIRTRQHLTALVPHDDVIVLEILRYPYELQSAEGLNVPSGDLAEAGVTDTELAMAAELIGAISKPFLPEDTAYRDTYRDDLLALIENKARGESVRGAQSEGRAAEGEVIDIVALLRRSLEEAREAGG
jgi:DNA end-binding protein Ku